MQTIEEIRLDRLRDLLAEYGTQAELARVVERSAKQVNQWFGKGSARPMSSSTARHIEGRCQKPRGWMDNVQIMYDPGQSRHSWRSIQETADHPYEARPGLRKLLESIQFAAEQGSITDHAMQCIAALLDALCAPASSTDRSPG